MSDRSECFEAYQMPKCYTFVFNAHIINDIYYWYQGSNNTGFLGLILLLILDNKENPISDKSDMYY